MRSDLDGNDNFTFSGIDSLWMDNNGSSFMR